VAGVKNLVDALLIDFLDGTSGNSSMVLSEFCLVVIDFSLVRDVHNSSMAAAIAISNFFDSIGSSFSNSMVTHNAVLFSPGDQPSDLVRREAVDLAARHGVGHRAVKMLYPLEPRSARASDAQWVWSMMILARALSDDQHSASMDSLSSLEILRRAASTLPIVRSPRRLYVRHRPSYPGWIEDGSIVAIDFVGYTQYRRGVGGADIGRGIFEELKACVDGSMVEDRSNLLLNLYAKRVKQQLEIDEVLEDVSAVATDCGGRVMRMGVDGGVGNDGPIAVIPDSSVEAFLLQTRRILDAARFPFAAVIGSGASMSMLGALERKLSAEKDIIGRRSVTW
jgi:hypothetical protein